MAYVLASIVAGLVLNLVTLAYVLHLRRVIAFQIDAAIRHMGRAHMEAIRPIRYRVESILAHTEYITEELRLARQSRTPTNPMVTPDPTTIGSHGVPLTAWERIRNDP